MRSKRWKSPPQAENFWGRVTLAKIPPLVSSKSETRGGIFARNTTDYHPSPLIKKNLKSGSSSFQILRIKKWKRGLIFSGNVGWVLFCEICAFFLHRFCPVNKKVSKIPHKFRRASRGVLFFSDFDFGKVISGFYFFQISPEKCPSGLSRGGGGLFTIAW